MTVFITRDLVPDSEFQRLLTGQGWQVRGTSLVEFSALPFAPLAGADWIFFSSRNAVRFFFQHLEQAGWPLPDLRWAALGEATANTLAGYVRRVDFTGTGDPADTAGAFGRIAAGSRVLFPGARYSQQSVQRLLADRLEGRHLEVYDNRPLADPPPCTEQVLVFTSPLNAEAYLAHHALLPDQRVVAIGATTAAALRRLGLSSVVTAAAPTETALAQAVMEL